MYLCNDLISNIWVVIATPNFKRNSTSTAANTSTCCETMQQQHSYIYRPLQWFESVDWVCVCACPENNWHSWHAGLDSYLRPLSKVKATGQEFTVTGWKMFLFPQWIHVTRWLRWLHILNRQRAAPNVHRTLRHHKTTNWLSVKFFAG